MAAVPFFAATARQPPTTTTSPMASGTSAAKPMSVCPADGCPMARNPPTPSAAATRPSRPGCRRFVPGGNRLGPPDGPADQDRENQVEDQQRLHHREAAEAEGHDLEGEGRDVRPDGHQPQRLPDQVARDLRGDSARSVLTRLVLRWSMTAETRRAAQPLWR